jgi:hypothetical protein
MHQVIVSLLLSAVMLGVKATSLIAIIRTINRKQELGILIGELKKDRSSSMLQEALAERVRRATEHAPGETGIVRFISQARPKMASLLGDIVLRAFHCRPRRCEGRARWRRRFRRGPPLRSQVRPQLEASALTAR